MSDERNQPGYRSHIQLCKLQKKMFAKNMRITRNEVKHEQRNQKKVNQTNVNESKA